MTRPNLPEVSGTKKAPKRSDGSYLYVVTEKSWGRTSTWLVAAKSLADAKAAYGWTRNNYASRRVHRASMTEVDATPGYGIPPTSSDERQA